MRTAIEIATERLKHSEGCKLEAYPDPASRRAAMERENAAARRRGRPVPWTAAQVSEAPGDPWTIGYGATGPEIVEGTVWTIDDAVADLAHRVAVLDQQIGAILAVETTANMRAALIELGYNIGIGRADNPATPQDEGRGLRGSTLIEILNAGDIEGAADQFLVWNKAKGKVMDGLTARRERERDLFLTPDDAAA